MPLAISSDRFAKLMTAPEVREALRELVRAISRILSPYAGAAQEFVDQFQKQCCPISFRNWTTNIFEEGNKEALKPG